MNDGQRTHTGKTTTSAGVVLAGVAVLILSLLGPAPTAVAQTDVQPARVAGETRLETAAAIAGLAYPGGVAEVVLADSTTFPGALTGSALAGALDAPVLLNPPAALADTTTTALSDLGVQRITIVGGPDEISPEVEAALTGPYIVDRIAGADVYETAAEVARATEFVAGGLPTADGLTTVLLASGEDFPDALALSGPAHDGAFPLLLTQPDVLPDVTAAVIDGLQPQQVIVAGGTDAVRDTVLDQVEALGATTLRLGGRNRTETAAVIADHFIDLGYFTATVAHLARGDAFPDALAAGVLSSINDGPILLTATQGLLSEETGAWFTARCGQIDVLQVVGGTQAVSIDVANGAEGLAETCEPPTVPPSTQVYEVFPQQELFTPAPGTADFTVAGRTDDTPIAGPLDLVLFPCATADVVGSGPDTFTDADGDGGADGFATTDTGNARIAVVNGVDVEDTTVMPAEPDEDGRITVRLASSDPDCTVMVVVDGNGNGNGQLDVDADGVPVEDYGVAKVTFTS